MTNQSAAQPGDDPRALLAATRDLTQRVRVAQRGAWFPLLVFAAVTVAAIPFNRYGLHTRHCGATAGGGYICTVHAGLALWYWPIALLLAYVAIGWFYLLQSHRRGVATRVTPYVVAGVVLTVLVAGWALWANTHPVFLADTLHLQPGRPSQFVYRVTSPTGAIGLTLLLLAGIERSWRLLAVTVAYLIVVVAAIGTGWFLQPTPWAFLPHLLIETGVLLAGGVLLAVAQRAQGTANP